MTDTSDMRRQYEEQKRPVNHQNSLCAILIN